MHGASNHHTCEDGAHDDTFHIYWCNKHRYNKRRSPPSAAHVVIVGDLEQCCTAPTWWPGHRWQPIPDHTHDLNRSYSTLQTLLKTPPSSKLATNWKGKGSEEAARISLVRTLSNLTKLCDRQASYSLRYSKKMTFWLLYVRLQKNDVLAPPTVLWTLMPLPIDPCTVN
jgi:hypothetical protein